MKVRAVILGAQPFLPRAVWDGSAAPEPETGKGKTVLISPTELALITALMEWNPFSVAKTRIS